MYDIEDILADIKTALTDNLNTKIAAITTEKNDGITLATVDSNALFMQSLDNEMTNYDPFVFYGITDITTTNAGPYPANEYTIAVFLTVADDGSGEEMTKKALRYHRALSESFTEHWNKSAARNKIEISNLAPLEIEMLNTSKEFRAVGIELRTTI